MSTDRYRLMGGRGFRRADGFTLLEIMMAIGVLALGMLGVLMMFVVATETHRRAVHASQTAQMAEALLAELQSEMFFEPDGKTIKLPVYDPDAHPPAWGDIVIVPDGSEGSTFAAATNKGHPDFPGYRYSLYLNRLDDAAATPLTCDTQAVKVILVITYRSGENEVKQRYETLLPIKAYGLRGS